MLTDSQVLVLKIAFNAWRAIEMIEGRSYPDKDDHTFRIIAARAVKYNALDGARSAWTRAAKELADEGIIELKQSAQPIEIDDAFRSAVQSMSSSELLKRINTDQTFKAKFDALAQEDAAPRSATADKEYSLTVAQYNALPAEIVQRKYRADAAFARAVDKLFSSNSVRTTNIR